MARHDGVSRARCARRCDARRLRAAHELQAHRARVGAQSAHTTHPMVPVSSTTAPKAMRYQANGTKSCVET